MDDVKELLDSLHKQTCPALENLFIGERHPELCQQVKEYGILLGMDNLLTIFNDGIPGLSPARNLGAKSAKADIIAFIDDDAIATPDWLEQMVSVLSANPNAIGVGGAALPQWEEENMNWLPKEFYWMISCPVPEWTGASTVKPVRNAWGVNMAFRREAFSVAEFSEDFGVSNQGVSSGIKLAIQADDTEFCVRLRKETERPILFNPMSKVFHKIRKDRLTPRFTSRQAFWDGYGKATLGRMFNSKEDNKTRFRLSNEMTFMSKLLFPFLPKMLLKMFVNPKVGFRSLSLMFAVLGHGFLGYISGRFGRVGGLVVRRYSK
jgi:GT2 family glycosyltransferase